MAVTVIVGSQWGDEGKGKIVDLLSENVDVVARFQGGPNAGHTVVVGDKEVVLHQIPSGILRPHTTCVIGNGVVVDPALLIDEIQFVKDNGMLVDNRLLISERAHIITSYHRLLDKSKETANGDRKIGTTGRGIGPAYVDKYDRIGVRFIDLLHQDSLRQRIEQSIQDNNMILQTKYKTDPVNADEVIAELEAFGKYFAPFLAETSVYMNKAISDGKNVLIEGAQGALLDIDFGTYPFVTSSSPTAGGACCGLGIGPKTIDKVLGILKAYTTRVGMGPFPTEFDEAYSEKIRTLGGEFGATTGRPRRCGWFDAVLVNHSVRINGLTHFAVTKLDVLDTLKEIKICTGYKLNGEIIDYFPADVRILGEIEPVYEVHPGWETKTSDCRKRSDLPVNAIKYLDRLQELTQVPVDMISVGPERSQTIVG